MTGLELTEGKDGVYLPVKAQPGARRAGIAGLHGGALKVALRAPPEDGRANEELIGLLAEALGVPKVALTITRGQTSRRKVVAVRGVDAATLRARLDDYLKELAGG